MLRTIVLLTVFRKARQHEQRQIDRAVRAQMTCERDHRGPAAQTYERQVRHRAHHPLLRRLAAALNADVRLTGGHDLGSVWFETHAA